MKTAEQQEDDLLVNIGRLSYCANQNDWKRFEMLLRAFTNQIQSDAIESTVSKCAEIAANLEFSMDISAWVAMDKKQISATACIKCSEAILSLIPQKEKKV